MDIHNTRKKVNYKSKLLSQGAYGCIYYPGIACTGTPKKTKDVVTKLQKNSFNSINEINIGKMIMTIPNYHYYFLPVIKSCPIKLKSIHNSEQLLAKCDIVNGKDDAAKIDYILMEIPYVSNISFYDGIGKKHTAVKLIETYTTLINALDLLVDHHIVHLDLKGDNILYNIKTGTAQIIDFGLSIPIDKLTSETLVKYFFVYSPDYYVWPLEVHVINFLLHKLHDNEAIFSAAHVNEIVTSVVNALTFLLGKALLVENYKEVGRHYLTTFIGHKRSQIIDKLIKTYKTWDNYSLSVLYLTKQTELLPEFYQLLLTNITPDPTKRYSIKETKRRFIDLFTPLDI
jgi:serine/threonine protein kinase